MYFCMKMKIRTTGKIAMIPKAIVEFQRLVAEESVVVS